MIYNLRKKFILISAVSVIVVFILILFLICVVSFLQLNDTMDSLTDVISKNDGAFPVVENLEKPHEPKRLPHDGDFSPETRFSTRFFTVWVDDNGNMIRENIEQISSVSKNEAQKYATEALSSGKERGWIDDYRFRVYESEWGSSVVFVNGEANKAMTDRTLYAVFFVMLGSSVVILLLIIIISKRAVRPAAESYEKQKQFITDANHELKTPLTIMLSNVDIVESEIGHNEWLDDIRSEGLRMGELINQLVTLSRMDEDKSNLNIAEFDLSDTVNDTVSEFEGLAVDKNRNLSVEIEPSVKLCGDEALLRRLILILLDNAIKYCDDAGEINVCMFSKGRQIVITVENSYREVNNIDLDKLFDRFYRADKARTYSGSFGIGLSIAKSIVNNHHGDISVYNKNGTHIGFKIVFR